MPEINETTEVGELTIKGLIFQCYVPYAEGHTLTIMEASTLNQTWKENIRNNVAADIEAAKEKAEVEGIDIDAAAKELFEVNTLAEHVLNYSSEYEFGRRPGGGGRTGDPVHTEAMDISRRQVREALKKKGYQLKDVGADEITRLAKATLAKYPALMEKAKAIVEARSLAAEEVTVELEG
jgi:hypothetical protein